MYQYTNVFDNIIKNAIQDLKQHHMEEAEEKIKQAMLINPSSSIVHNLYGVLKELLGNDILARKYYRVANEFDPTYIPAIHNLDRIASRHHFNCNALIDFGDN